MRLSHTNTLLRGLRLAVLGLTVLFLAHSSAQAQSPSDVARRIKTTYNGARALKADFVQEAAAGGASMQGVLTLQGAKYRIETSEQTIVSDGKTVWVHNRPDEQLIVNNAVEDETTFSLNDFLRTFDRKYTISKVETAAFEGAPHLKARLLPKRKDNYYKEIVLWLRARDNVISKLEVVDVQDYRMSFRLRNVQLNPKVGKATFTFLAPRGVEVVDLR